MAKASSINKLVNGEIADADVVNSIIETAGNQGGAMPYDDVTNAESTDGTQNMGQDANPWGALYVDQDTRFVEINITSHTEANSVSWKNLRRFIFLKDAPGNGVGNYTGNAGKFVQVKLDESGLQFAAPVTSQLFTSSGTFVCPAGVTKIYITAIAGGGGGSSASGFGSGASGQWIQQYAYNVTAGNSYTVTIGAGGTGAGTGNPGGNTVFDVSGGALTLIGGSGAANTAVNNSNAGGLLGISSPSNGLNGGSTPFGAGGSSASAAANTGAGAGHGTTSVGGSGFVLVQY